MSDGGKGQKLIEGEAWNTVHELQATFHTSADTVKYYQYVLDHGADDIKEQMLLGDIKVRPAYKLVKQQEEEQAAQTALVPVADTLPETLSSIAPALLSDINSIELPSLSYSQNYSLFNGLVFDLTEFEEIVNSTCNNINSSNLNYQIYRDELHLRRAIQSAEAMGTIVPVIIDMEAREMVFLVFNQEVEIVRQFEICLDGNIKNIAEYILQYNNKETQ